MNHWRDFLAVATAEVRIARRLARTWIFLVLAALLGVLTYLQFAAIHGFGSGFSSTVGAFGPRTLITSVGMVMVVVLVLGIVFLAFDVRARDERERIADVLDSRAVGNVVLLGGRLAGVVFILWLAVVAILGLLQLIGVTAKALDWWIGDTVEPVSLVSFLFVDALPTLVLWGSLVVLLAVVVRNRLVVAILALGIFGLYAWSGFLLPYYLMRVLSAFQATVVTASDVLPQVAHAELIGQRLCTLVLAGGFLVLAAALHPRRDGSGPGPQFALGGGLVALAVAGVVVLVVNVTNARAAKAEWTAAHVAIEGQPRDDLKGVRGKVSVEPGRRLDLDLVYDLELAARGSELVLSFNPGLRVSEVRVDGAEAEATHESGLLRIALPAPGEAGERVQLELAAGGYPDATFGYLDSALDLDLVEGESANVILLGADVTVFDRRYVALMPGGRWLPMPGAATGQIDPANYKQDYFDLDLEVEVPDGWLVAGPGRRRETDGGMFRFAPPAPVPAVALLASRFERRSMAVGGVEFELLLHRGHGEHLDEFADSLEAIKERVGEILADAQALGLAYPYEGFSLVEVPSRLRVFGGGWRMDSVQAQPGILMLRETGLPTARFDTMFRILAQFGGLPQGEEAAVEAAQVKLALLEQFFSGDFSGGSLVDGATRNFLRFQAGAEGKGAVALDQVIHELIASLVLRRAIGVYFSPRTFASSADLNEQFAQLAGALFSGGGLRIALNATPPAPSSVWSRALGAPLATLDPSAGAMEALDVLALKAPAVARSMLDGAGRDKVGALLAELRRRHAGSNFTIDDFDAAARETGADLDALLGDWLGDASLPGFLMSDAHLERIADDETGRPRYQVRVHVHNGEPIPGLVRLSLILDAEEVPRAWGDPVRVAAGASVELGMVVETPPAEAWLAPYLSLNRRDIRLLLGDYDAGEVVEAEPFNGSRSSDWRPPPETGIVVDDLDPGFDVVYATPADEERYAEQMPTWLGGGNVDFDQGLQVYNPMSFPPRGWARIETPGTWGRYRHTLANAFDGDGAASARFTAQLPHAGRWRVDYHVPMIESQEGGGGGGVSIRVNIERGVLAQEKGIYEMKIVADGIDEAVEFDAAAANEGWNDLGEFTLPAGEASLLVSNDTDGSGVVADAVRWRPVEAR